MENQFYNQPVVDWARQNLAQPVEIEVLFSSRWGKIFVYLLLFLAPLVFILLGIVMTILRTHQEDKSGFSALACGFVMLIPTGVIVILGALTRGKFAKTLAADGVKSSMGRKLLWENLYYVDHVSKHSRAGGVSRVTKDNQLELVFADGKAIIPPLIKNRQQIWNLINSMPAEVRDDGKGRKSAASTFNAFIEQVEQAENQRKSNK